MSFSFPIGQHTFSKNGPYLLIAGPCVIESESHAMGMAEHIQRTLEPYQKDYLWVFKASFDKANRSSGSSPRGPGMKDGLRILAKIRDTFGVPVLTDVHESYQAKEVGSVVDILQIPAFLCRQTDLLKACAETGKVVNVKKGQFLSPAEMNLPVQKIKDFGNQKVIMTERGTSFGYNNLIVDFAGFQIMKTIGAPLILDATHCVQLPGGLGSKSGGRREIAPFMAKAAAAVGVDGFFMEVHDNPDQALSDGPNQLNLPMFKALLPQLVAIRKAIS